MASIAERLEDAQQKLNVAVDPGPHSNGVGMLIMATAQLLEVVRRQEERTQRIAQALDELASKISGLSTSPREVREQAQAIARLIRDEQQE